MAMDGLTPVVDIGGNGNGGWGDWGGAQTRADMQSMLNTILNHMTYKTPTTSGGGTTA